MILNVDLAIKNWDFDIAMLNDQRVSHSGWYINFVSDNSPSENRYSMYSFKLAENCKVQEGGLKQP